jgi:acetylornithine deacetylase
MNNSNVHNLYDDAISLLKELIQTPSFSKEEDGTASIISRFLAQKGLATSRVGNNVFAVNQHFDAAKPTILLNSHHDTVWPRKQ